MMPVNLKAMWCTLSVTSAIKVFNPLPVEATHTQRGHTECSNLVPLPLLAQVLMLSITALKQSLERIQASI